MAYIGSTPTSQNFISGTDYFNGTGSQTAFTLTRSVNSVNDVEVVVNNVIQQPNSYTVSGTTLTLSAAPSSGTSNVYVRYLATNQQSFTVGNNTVGYNQLTTDMQSKFAMKNRIINGAMVIDQRNAGASVTPTNGQFLVDRWSYYGSQSSKFTAQQNQGSVTLPAGFIKYLGFTSSSAYSSTATDYFLFQQGIEGFNTADLAWGTASAKTVTLSFQVYSSLTGTFGGVLMNTSNTRCYPFTYTVSSANTWTAVSVTVAGCTDGVWPSDNTGGIYVVYDLGCGSNYRGAAGAWSTSNLRGATGTVSVVGTNGATFYITGVQLEVGSSATGFEYRQYQQELALCQRYYQTVRAAGGAPNGATSLVISVQPSGEMRAGPTVGQTGVLSISTFLSDQTQSSTGITVYTNYNNLIIMALLNLTGLSGGVPWFLRGANTNSITLSAEL